MGRGTSSCAVSSVCTYKKYIEVQLIIVDVHTWGLHGNTLLYHAESFNLTLHKSTQ